MSGWRRWSLQRRSSSGGEWSGEEVPGDDEDGQIGSGEGSGTQNGGDVN